MFGLRDERKAIFQGALLLLILALGLGIALLPLQWAGALVLGGVIFLLTAIRPAWGLYFLAFAVPFGSLYEVQVQAFRVGLTEALVGLALAAWLARMAALRRVHIPRPPLLFPLLLFLGATLLSWLGAFSLAHSVKESVKWAEVVGIYLLVASLEESGAERRWLALCLLAAGCAQALLGFYQFFGRVGPEHFLLFERFMRAYGTFEQPNPYAGYLGLVLPLAYGLFLTRLTAPLERRVVFLPALAFYGLCLSVMGAAMVMSWSRGAWLGAAAALVVVSVARSRRAALLFGGMAVLLLFLAFLGSLNLLPEFISQRFADVLPYLRPFDVREVEVSPENWAVVERMAHWQAGWEMFSAHPWLGVGFGNYAPIYPAYALPGWDEPLGHAHNYYLNLAAETGLVGLAAYLLFWGASLREGWRAVRCSSGFAQGVALGVLGVLAHLTVHNFFDNLYVHGMYVHFAMLLGLVAGAQRQR